MDKKIARVFARKTKASPDDDLAFFSGPGLFPPEVDEVHISVVFKDDCRIAEGLAKQWRGVAPVKIGGPGCGDPGGEFVPGRYLREGFVITSRGCPNRCWFCDVWQRDGKLRELSVVDGWIVQDDNLLACSDDHVRNVFSMLSRQKERARLMGMEAARLKVWHVDELWRLRPEMMFFAYDEKDDIEPLVVAGRLLRFADFTRKHLRCYVLIGFPGDTISAAEVRMIEAWRAGFMPCAMLWEKEKADCEWLKLQKVWMRPAIIRSIMRGNCSKYF